jgi:hypothetical protein
VERLLVELVVGEPEAIRRIGAAEPEIRATSETLWELTTRYAHGEKPGTHD